MDVRASSSSVGTILIALLTILLVGTILVSVQTFVHEVDQSRDQVEGLLDSRTGAPALDAPTDAPPITTPPTDASPDGGCAGDEHTDEQGRGRTCEEQSTTPIPNGNAGGR